MTRTFKAGRRSYTMTDRHGIVRSVERRAEKLIINCGGSARSIEMQNALVSAEGGNEWRMSTGASFLVQPGNKVSVIFAAVNGGAPHAGLVKNVDTGAAWWWSMEPLLPNYRWLFAAIAMLLAVWIAIWSLAGESSRQRASYAILLGVALVSAGMAVRFVRRKRLTSVLRTTMEGATH
jgi:hypothetical protein